ncbi:hypothetical protein [Sulfurivermis fontis]|jgi:hypothetical protein|nr:hypothetical protein [Sulfurivermis fontis]
MCVSFPVPPEFHNTGRRPGPIRLFLGAVALVGILLFSVCVGWVRRS